MTKAQFEQAEREIKQLKKIILKTKSSSRLNFIIIFNLNYNHCKFKQNILYTNTLRYLNGTTHLQYSDPLSSDLHLFSTFSPLFHFCHQHISISSPPPPFQSSISCSSRFYSAFLKSVPPSLFVAYIHLLPLQALPDILLSTPLF